MSVLNQRNKANTGYEEVSITNPLPVEAAVPFHVTSGLYRTGSITIPGVATGSAYTAGDAFGTSFTIPVPVEGTIANLVFLDFDDEGLIKEFVLFDGAFTETADNSAFAVSDGDLAKCIGVITVDTFHNFGSNQVGVATPALGYRVESGQIRCQVVTRGADNIAAGAVPAFFMVVV